MRRSLFHVLLVLATAPAVLSVSAASSASAVTAPQVSGHEAAGRSAPLALAGGLRAVPVQGAGLQAAAPSPNLPPGWHYDGPVRLANSRYPKYVITVQAANSNGRRANRLYMWANNGRNTQVFYQWSYRSTYIRVYASKYNGKCISIPGASRTPGTQLIVYSCIGLPTNERFQSWKAGYLTPIYNRYLALAIGSGFPGNGAWVITYGLNPSNWKEKWS